MRTREVKVSTCRLSDANFLHFKARKEFPLGMIGGSQSPKHI